jgi:hypothetical protein
MVAIWGALVVSVCLMVAGNSSWPDGLLAGVGLGGATVALFRVARSRWDRIVESAAAETVAQAERLLRGE